MTVEELERDRERDRSGLQDSPTTSTYSIPSDHARLLSAELQRVKVRRLSRCFIIVFPYLRGQLAVYPPKTGILGSAPWVLIGTLRLQVLQV